MVSLKKFVFHVVYSMAVWNTAIVESKPFKIQPRISGGYQSSTKQFPYMVAIYDAFLEVGSLLCGGSIISEYHILSSASSIMNYTTKPEVLFIRLGSEYGNGPFEAYVKDIFLHPKFNSDYLLNDISIVRTIEKITFNEAVQPIALPTIDLTTVNGLEAIVTGWGHSNVMIFKKSFFFFNLFH